MGGSLIGGYGGFVESVGGTNFSEPVLMMSSLAVMGVGVKLSFSPANCVIFISHFCLCTQCFWGFCIYLVMADVNILTDCWIFDVCIATNAENAASFTK